MATEKSTTCRACPDCGVSLEGTHHSRKRCRPCAKENRRKYRREYGRLRYHRPAVKAKQRERQRTPAYKAQKRGYLKRPYVKAMVRERLQRPDVRAREQERLRAPAYREKVRDYQQRLEVKAARASRLRLRKPWDSTVTAKSVTVMLDAKRGRCAACGTNIRDGYHMDHIQPMARGGESTFTNLQLLCGTCNLKKHAKDPYEFAMQRGRLFI